jgi:hypothetical protein
MLIVQIWLLNAAPELFLAGNHHTALRAVIFYLFVDEVDSEVRRSGQER